MGLEGPHTIEGDVATAHVAPTRCGCLSRRSRRRTARRLANALERVRLLSSMSSLGFWGWDRASDAAWASRHARNILGLDASARLTRDTLIATIHPEDRAHIARAIRGTRSHGDSIEMEFRVVREGREMRWITSRARVYRDANGMILRVVGYVIDDSRRKRAEAESLKKQQQITHLTRVAMLGELSGALAHELQQPLTAILCNAQAGQLLAARAPTNVEELREIFTDIVSADRRAGQIIQHLRALLKRGERQAQRLMVAGLVRDVLSLTRVALSERNIQVHLQIEEGLPGVLGDPVELQQVLLNLLLNACDSMSDNAEDDRRIEIVAAFDAEQCVVRTSVLDCGKGIAADQLDRVFEAFFTTKASGLGLGLSLCKSIIVAHKGRLWVENRVERGAAFHFNLPVFTKEGEQ
jgi:PAS domain S-box-containing protein